MLRCTLWNTEVELTIPSLPSKEVLAEMDEHASDPNHGFFPTPYGKLHYRQYLPDGEVKAVCIWQHGIGGHSGNVCKMSEDDFTNIGLLARRFKAAGYALYAPDMLGHGFSEGKRFYIPNGNYSVNRDGLESFAKFAGEQHTGIPMFLMGDSYGGCLALHVAKMWQDNPLEAPDNFKGICLNAPAIIGDLPSLPVVLFLRYILAPLMPETTPFFMPQPVSPDRIWRDHTIREHFSSDKEKAMQLQGGGKPFCLGTAKGLLNALEDVREKVIPGFKVPYSVAHGIDDWAVQIEGSKFLVEHSSTDEEDRSIRFVEGASHDLMADPTRQETVAFHLKWIESRL